jgi:methylmalonyl-CoA epimerase
MEGEAVKAVLDHVGIAVQDLPAALAFYRDALGLEVEAPEEVASQRVRAYFIPVGASTNLELLEATAPDSPIARYIDRRGPGLHHITLRVADIHAVVIHLTARGVRMVDTTPRPGAEGSIIAFVHPSSTQGVLVELKQSSTERPASIADAHIASLPAAPSGVAAATRVARYSLGNLELVSVSDGLIRLDGGAMFGVVPKPLWSRKLPADERNRVSLSMRPLVVRGARTMIIDAGVGDKENEKFHDIFGLDRGRHLDHTLAEAGLSAEDIDIVLASHLHFDHAGGFTMRGRDGRVEPRFPRAQYIVRRGEWEDAMHPNARTRASYLAHNFEPLAEAGVLQLVDDDQMIMPGVRVQRTGGHTRDHQIITIESGGKTAVFAADLLPTTAHLPDAWMLGFDLYPVETLSAKQRFIKQAIERDILVFFEHDLEIAAGYIREEDGKRYVDAA